MENQKLTFNEETYEFKTYFPNGKLSYSIHINNQLTSEWTLQQDGCYFSLYYNHFNCGGEFPISLGFNSIVDIIKYIKELQPHFNSINNQLLGKK